MVYGRKKAGATATRVSLSKWILYAAIRLVCEKHFVLVTDPFLAKGVLQWQKERKDRIFLKGSRIEVVLLSRNLLPSAVLTVERKSLPSEKRKSYRSRLHLASIEKGTLKKVLKNLCFVSFSC